MIHEYTTLPGHDPSKVRGADCITASASEALDVRVLKVAEWFATKAATLHAWPVTRSAALQQVETLRAIAAEIRDAATPRRPVPETNDAIAIWSADTVTQLRDVWSGSSARRLEMEPHDRIWLLEKAMGRLLVIEARHEGDGR